MQGKRADSSQAGRAENTAARKCICKGQPLAFAGFQTDQAVLSLPVLRSTASGKASIRGGHTTSDQQMQKMKTGLCVCLVCVSSRLTKRLPRTRTGLGIWINDKSCLEQIKACLAEDGAGMAPVKFYVATNMGEVELTLEYRFRLSGQLRQKLKSIAGISKFRKFDVPAVI